MLEKAPQRLGTSLTVSELGVDLFHGDGKRRQALAGPQLQQGPGGFQETLRTDDQVARAASQGGETKRQGLSDFGSEHTARVGEEVSTALFDGETHRIVRDFGSLPPKRRRGGGGGGKRRA